MKRFIKGITQYLNDFINSIIIVLIILLFWALFPINPYSYYILLRIIMFIFNLILFFNIYRQKNKLWLWVFIAMVSIYNPFFPIHLNRSIWSFVNISTIIVYVVYLKKIFRCNEVK